MTYQFVSTLSLAFALAVAPVNLRAQDPTPAPSPSASPTPAASPAKVQYTCAMHSEVISDKPGDCPKCGMKLVPKKDDAKKGDEKAKASVPR